MGISYKMIKIKWLTQSLKKVRKQYKAINIIPTNLIVLYISYANYDNNINVMLVQYKNKNFPLAQY